MSHIFRSLEVLRSRLLEREEIRDQLSEYNQELEKRVDERTRALALEVEEKSQIQQKLLQASKAKDEFLASMSHELRTPLTSIIGNAEYLYEKLSIPELREVAQSIETAGHAQLTLVNDILDMSKIESGKFTLDEAPFNLSRLIGDIQGMLAIRVQDAGLKLKVEQLNQETRKLLGDSNRIGQILINLLGNAIKFTEQGEVQLTTRVEGEWLQFVVEDSGIGMTEEEQSRLFRKFEQADGSISRRFGGSGLGLYISFNLAEMMGGKISVSSVKGRGSTFTLMIPYRRSDLLIDRVVDVKSEGSLLNQKFSGEVLVVEDTPELQLLEKRILEGMGVTVTTAGNGQEALDLIACHHFDLIFMDMQMPVMDGIEATRLLREQGYRTPVYALTANVMVKHREQFYQVGCDGFIAKPIDKSALQEVLRKHLQDGSTEGKRQAGLKMEPIEWHNDYAIGHPQIDSDHQAVVKGINALVHYCLREQQEGSREDVLMELSALHEVLFRHLQMEEELLRKSGYPQLTSHIESHHEYGGRLAQLYKSKLDDRKIEAMTTVLLGWWKHHILVEDLAYREHLQGWMQRHGEVQRHVVSRGEAEAEVDEELMAIFQQSATENRQQLKQALTQENWQRVKELAHSIKGSGASFGFPQLSEKAKVACDHYDQGELGVMPHAVQQLIDELDVVLR